MQVKRFSLHQDGVFSLLPLYVAALLRGGIPDVSDETGAGGTLPVCGGYPTAGGHPRLPPELFLLV